MLVTHHLGYEANYIMHPEVLLVIKSRKYLCMMSWCAYAATTWESSLLGGGGVPKNCWPISQWVMDKLGLEYHMLDEYITYGIVWIICSMST